MPARCLRQNLIAVGAASGAVDSVLAELVAAIRESTASCAAPAVCLSGGLDSTIVAYHMRDGGRRAVAVIARDFLATDLAYCQLAAAKLGMPLKIKWASGVEMLDSAEETVKILGNFNDIEIRNSIVMHLAILALKEIGMRRAATGDGADELFAGYNFLVRKSDGELEAELKRVQRIMHFPSQAIGKREGVEIVSPYLDERVVRLAGQIPASMKVGERGGGRIGKWALRKAYEHVLPKSIVWRSKSPMQDGAGTSGISALFSSLISDETFEKRRSQVQRRDGVTLRTKESIFYYEAFLRHYGTPPQADDQDAACPYCRSAVLPNSRFCRMCGAYPI